MNGISKLLSTDGFIQVNKYLIQMFGLHEAVLIGELCAEYNYWEQQNKLIDGMFFSSRENIEANTGLNEHFQRKALITLKNAGIVSVIKRGLPATNHYMIHFDKLLTMLSSSRAPGEELDTESVNLNNNKTRKIEEEKDNPKGLSQEQPKFEFGKRAPKKENLFTKCVNLIDSCDFSPNIRKLLIEYLQFRLSVKDKPLYFNMWKGMLAKLCELCEDDIKKYEAVIKQSIERGYLSFYPINSSNKGIKYESGAEHVPGMTQDDYDEEEKLMAELEAKGVQTVF